MAGPGERAEWDERRAALHGMLWVFAAFGGYRIVHLLVLALHVVVIAAIEPNVDPGTPNVATLVSADGVGGAWANAFFVLALLSCAANTGVLWLCLRRGLRPGPAWQPLGLGLVGVAAGLASTFAGYGFQLFLARHGVERVAAYAYAVSIEGMIVGPFGFVLTIGALVTLGVLAHRARARVHAAGPYRSTE